AAVESKISTQNQSKDKAEARTGAGAGVGLTPIQEWFFEQHQIEPNYYNMPVMLEPRRKIETGVLQQSLNRVTSRHTGLRLRLGGQSGDRVFWLLHHAVVDGVSWRILLEELQTAYEEVEKGRKGEWLPQSSGYEEWAEKINEWGERPDGVLVAQESFWLRQK